MDKEALMLELEVKFEETKKELGFESTLEDVDGVCYIKDAILSVGYVSESFNRQLASRLVDTYYSWVGQFQAWLTPGLGGSIVNHNEVKSFTDEDREEIKKLVEKAMYFLRADKINGIKRDLKEQGKLIDEMVKNRKDFFDKLTVLLEKTRDGWDSN